MSWEVKRLEEVCVVDWGNTNLTKASYVEGGPCLAVSAAGCDGRIGHAEHSAGIPVMSAIGAQCGRMFFPEEPFTAIKNTITITPKDGQSMGKYLFYALTHFTLPQRGAGQPFISKGDTEAFEIPCPPLPEQHRIVGKLDAAFAALGEAEGLVARNRANARELFESYLNGVFEGKGDGWVEKRLGDLGETRTGSTPPTNDRSNYGDYAPFVKPGDFNVDGSIDYRGDGVSKRGFELSRPIPANSILMVCVGATIGKTGFVDREVTSNQQINSLSPRSEFFPKYIYYALISRRFFEAVLHNSSQATLPIISKSKWENLTITLPKDRKVQERIANELDELSMRTKELEATYQQKLLELAGLKKAVLGAAFRGEL